jgi:hypothetical protein
MGAAWLATGGNFTPARIVLADQRKAGVPFDVAWPRAVAAVARDDRATLLVTRAAWKCEYEGRRSQGGGLMARVARDTRHRPAAVA